MRRLPRVLIWAVFIYLLFCTAVAFFLASITVHPYRRPILAAEKAEVRQAAENLNAKLADVEIEAEDHASLRAWLILPQHANGNAVILLHGLGDNRLGMIGYAQLLLSHGYAVLMPDARAHGESGGDLVTYGIIERDDIRRWYEWLDETEHPGCVYGLGESMGAAQLLQALAVEPHFCAVVAESSFATFREIAYDRMGQRFGTGPWLGRTLLRPVIEIALAIARVKYHVDLTQASPQDAVAHTRVPVLLIHGVVDSNIPLRHSLRLVAHNPQMRLWQVPGADHCGAISSAPKEFEQTVLAWFDTHKAVGQATAFRATAN
jgi:dipeptidyl aminopeptidase/acylaminoacyl peptidase